MTTWIFRKSNTRWYSKISKQKMDK